MKAHSWICLLLSCKCNHFHCSAIMEKEDGSEQSGPADEGWMGPVGT